MKKYMFLTLALLLSAATGAWAQDKNNDCADNSPVADKAVQASRVAAARPRKVAAKFGEVEFSFNCSTASQYGVATDGEYIYTSNWGYSDLAETFFKYDLDGNFIEAFNIPDVPKAIRDMTYDGEYFYGATNSNTVYIMDLENKTKIGTLTIPIAARGITYDPKRDGFWAVGNWSGPLALYDRDGNRIQDGIYAGDVSGIAYYEDEDGEEHILQLNNGNNYVYDYNITTNTLDGAVLYLGNVPGNNGSSGGAFIGEYNGQVCLFADIQQDPNLIGIVPIANAKPVDNYDLTGTTGKCFWGYNEEKKELTIWGDGAMANYSDAQDCPWYEFADDVETLIIKSGVTRIGHRAFYSMERLTFATIPNTVETIGNYAFYSCTRLPFISIPASVTDMGRDIFWHCYEMKNAYVYADVNVLTWTDTDCDDFTLNRNTKCHVTDADAWNEKFGESVNVTFVGDLKPVPAAYANEDAFELNEGENKHGKIVFYADGVVATKAKAGAAVMVIVKPIKGYIAELVYGTGYSSWEQAQSRMKKAPTMDIIGDIEFTKLKDNVWSFAMPGSDVEISVVYRKLMTHNSIKIQNIQAVTYNGEFLKPTFTVKDGTKVLTLDTDYTVEYSNNFNAALATDANAPTLTVTGIGSYAGETTKTFTINKKALTVTAVDTTVVYAGEPAFDVEYNGFVGEETEDVLGGELAYECDYTTESPVGSTFTITPSGLTAQNYIINFATGTLTVVEDLTDAKAALQTAIAIASNINPEGLADAIAAAQTALTAEDATGESLAQATETLEAAIKTYLGEVLPKLGAIVEGLNDETLNAAYADAQAALAKEDVTPQELVAAMQNIITAAQAVAPEHLQNLKGYAEKYGAEEAATLVDNALAAIEAGNVSQIITTMTAVRETATPLATAILTQIIGYAQSYSGFEEDVTAAQAALDGGNYITMITTAKALYAKLMAAANDYVASAKAIPTEGKVGVDELNAAITAAEQALAAQDSDFSAINTAIANLVAAVKAFEEANKTTGVEKIENGKLKIENYYDLNGRKVNGQLKKGVYIVGGHKVVIK